MKKFIPFFFVAVSIAVSLVIVEIGLRYFLSQRKLPLLRDDRPKRHYFSEFANNNRDYAYPEHKAPNTFRIIAVGDSFTYGFGNWFDDAYPKRLERLLNLNKNQPRIEVLNFGAPGYSTAMEEKLVRRALEKFEPDLILLEITLNDPETHPLRGPRGTFDKSKRDKQGFRLITWDLIRERIRNTRSYSQYISYYNDLFSNPETKDPFYQALQEIKKSCEDKKVPLIATIFPLLSFPFDEHYPFKEPHRITQKLLQSLNIPYLDLFDAFKGIDPLRVQAIQPGLPKADPHPNEIGHRIAAEALYRWMAKNQFIPKEAIARCTAKQRIGPSPIRCASAPSGAR